MRIDLSINAFASGLIVTQHRSFLKLASLEPPLTPTRARGSVRRASGLVQTRFSSAIVGDY
jgi:hypothetical protein